MKLLLASIRHYSATGTRNPIRLHRRDEIGAVITAFNEMLERETEREAALNHSKRQLESSKSDLARLNQNLEQRVRDRTVDLAAKNSALQREIETREFAERDRDTAETRLFEAIDSMSEGFAVWASDDRLVMCNSRYLAGFEKLSDILVPGVHFADLIDDQQWAPGSRIGGRARRLRPRRSVGRRFHSRTPGGTPQSGRGLRARSAMNLMRCACSKRVRTLGHGRSTWRLSPGANRPTMSSRFGDPRSTDRLSRMNCRNISRRVRHARSWTRSARMMLSGRPCCQPGSRSTSWTSGRRVWH